MPAKSAGGKPLANGALVTSVHSSQPPVHAKGLKSVVLLKERGDRWKLDHAPFLVLYSLILTHGITTYFFDGKWGHFPLVPALCAVGVLHVLVKLLAYWMVEVHSFISFTACSNVKDATHVKVIPAEFAGKKEIVPLEVRSLDDNDNVVAFNYRRQTFLYNAELGCFDKLKYPTSETFGYYRQCTGLGSEARVLAAMNKWGPNRFEVPVPTFQELLTEQLLAPFFVFQVFCVGLWCMDDYMMYSLFTLVMLVMFECTVVATRRKQMQELRSLQTPKLSLQVYRQGKWERLPSEALLPGDIISIGVPQGDAVERERVVPADLLLLAGTCIVEEAVLTGESTPQWKTPIDDSAGPSGPVSNVDVTQRLVIKRDKNFVLFGGTKVLQHHGERGARIRTPDNGCLALVLRTGFETAQGRLMRTILFSTERVTANNWETGLFICFLLVFAVSAAAYVAYHGLQDPERDRWKLLLNCIMIITSVIPPELPMELSIAVNASLLALVRNMIYCTEPFRITLAGKVEVCCFDKTGTLTSDDMVLEGVAGVPGQGPNLVRDLKEAGMETQRVLACCHSLVHVGGQLTGDPLERAAFLATGWTYSGEAISSGRQAARKESAVILHRFHFTSALKRMTCILKVEADAERGAEYQVVMKGAPEVVATFLEATPEDYETTYKRFAAQGGRVLALACKTLDPELGPAGARALPRDQVEAGLQFAGFAVLQCPLKPESEPALRHLRDSSHQLVMITGDAPLTAVHAASRVHIVDRPTLILQHRGPAEEHTHAAGEAAEPDLHYEWVTPDEATRLPFTREPSANLLLASEWDLCISGEGLHHLHQIGADLHVVPLAQVFARVSPDQKELILRLLRAAGWTTLMCGDGTNDVGALKSAHVGVALLAPREVRGGQAGPGPAGPGNRAVPQGTNGREAQGRGTRGRGRAHPLLTNGRGQAAPGQLVPVGGRGGRGAGRGLEAGRGRGGAAAGPGTRMLENLRRQGKEPTEYNKRFAAMLDEMANSAGDDGQVPMVKPGEASMAAPFTARQASVMPCTDIIRQGRSSLVTTVQMFKILGLLCLSTAYSMSVQYLQGVKLGDLQATVSGMLSAALFLVLSFAKPLPILSPERPYPNIFCAYVFLSILGQCLLHLGCLIYCYHMALTLMPKDEVQKPDGEFAPNLVNTVCFLINYQVQLSTFAVNYQGHPFNTGVLENPYMSYMLRYGSLLFVLLALDLIPGLNAMLQLVEIPQPLNYLLVGLAFSDFALAWTWEHFLRRSFPAAKPPQKPYLAHAKELETLRSSRRPAQHPHVD